MQFNGSRQQQFLTKIKCNDKLTYPVIKKTDVMKKLIFIGAMIPFLAFQCNKDARSGWLEGKVIRLSCASFVVQLINNNDIGEDGWKDMLDNNKEYNDVITASNKCEIPSTIQKDNIIRFRLEAPKAHNDCVICLMYDGPPQKAFEIKEISLK
jgi:hypothetical protein